MQIWGATIPHPPPRPRAPCRPVLRAPCSSPSDEPRAYLTCAAVRHRQLPALGPGDALVVAVLQAEIVVGAQALALRVEDLHMAGAAGDEDVAVRVGGERSRLLKLAVGAELA